MSYLDDEKFDEKPAVLGFNGGKAGVVRNCTVKVDKKGSGEKENAPEYKLIALDEDQIKNVAGIDEDKIYPVNKGYFYKDSFNSEKGEQFAVNELKHLLKTFGHEITKNSKGVDICVPKRDIKDYNDFMDYVMDFINTAIKEGNKIFDIVVDYGNVGYEKGFLQLGGYPWYIGKCGAKLENSRNAVLERPTPEDKDDSPKENESTSKWV